MNPVVIVMLVWFALAPIFLVLWLIARRKWGLLPDGAKSYAKLFSATCTPL